MGPPTVRLSWPQRVTQTFVQLADALVTDFDDVEFLQTVLESGIDLLAVDDGGLMIADQQSRLQILTLSSEDARLKQLFELQTTDGPCLDSYRTGQPILNISPDGMLANWPRFGPTAVSAGYRYLHAFPLRHRGQVVGAMNLLCSDQCPFSPDGITLAQGLADMATLGLVQHRIYLEPPPLSEQLQTALDTRVKMEQAKGVFAERAQTSLQDAFFQLRQLARERGRPLHEIAESVLNGDPLHPGPTAPTEGKFT